MQDLKGKRVSWVQGAPALNKAVEVGGYGASIDSIINGDNDAAEAATFSTSMVKLEASPRGLYHLPQPHADKEGWKRLNAVVPWHFPHKCMQGTAVPAEGYEKVSALPTPFWSARRRPATTSPTT
ncbi:MAG: hypothetical protein P1U65_13330 [Minwuia sp.]|nr:hypothetical protein [Minwuia sp.]